MCYNTISNIIVVSLPIEFSDLSYGLPKVAHKLYTGGDLEILKDGLDYESRLEECDMTTVLSSLLSALALSATLLTLTGIVDIKWSIAVDISDKAGKLLAEVLSRDCEDSHLGHERYSNVLRILLKAIMLELWKELFFMEHPFAILDENWEDARMVKYANQMTQRPRVVEFMPTEARNTCGLEQCRKFTAKQMKRTNDGCKISIPEGGAALFSNVKTAAGHELLELITQVATITIYSAGIWHNASWKALEGNSEADRSGSSETTYRSWCGKNTQSSMASPDFKMS
ncbi:transmembrane and coiled-coil domain-containing protein 4-like protein isoform X1 [Tanacetum coccineum]